MLLNPSDASDGVCFAAKIPGSKVFSSANQCAASQHRESNLVVRSSILVGKKSRNVVQTPSIFEEGGRRQSLPCRFGVRPKLLFVFCSLLPPLLLLPLIAQVIYFFLAVR